MGIAIVSIYLKLNIILFVAFLVWSAIRRIAYSLNFSLNSNKELSIAKIFFLLSLLVPIMFSVLSASLITTSEILGMTVIAQNISSGINSGLDTNITLAEQNIAILWLFNCLLGFGIFSQCYFSYRKYRQLKRVLNNSTSWKSFKKVNVMFSQEVTTPFSTKVLGVNQIILPYQLLESSRNFRLAVKHELQHIRNGDLHWVLLLELLKPFFFWNPAFYAWLNEFHCLQEYACDEALINKAKVSTKAYGHCLLEVASHSFDNTLFASSNMVPHFQLFKSPESQLKRRIIMMTQVKNQKFQKVKITLYSTTLLAALAGCSSSMLEATEDEKSEIIPVATIAPKYPQLALNKGAEGWALLEFTVTKQGNVLDPVIIGSCSNGEPMPGEKERSDRNTEQDMAEYSVCAEDNIFDSSSLTAIEKFKFEPKMVDGNPIDVPGVRYLFSYNLQ